MSWASSASASSSSSDLRVKVVLDGRIFSIPLSSPVTLVSLDSALRVALENQHSSIQKPSTQLQFHYLDEDGDQITLHDNHAIEHAVHFAESSGKALKLYLTVVPVASGVGIIIDSMEWLKINTEFR